MDSGKIDSKNRLDELHQINPMLQDASSPHYSPVPSFQRDVNRLQQTTGTYQKHRTNASECHCSHRAAPQVVLVAGHQAYPLQTGVMPCTGLMSLGSKGLGPPRPFTAKHAKQSIHNPTGPTNCMNLLNNVTLG